MMIMKAHFSELDDIRFLTKAYAFAAEKHRHQRRKDVHASPFINHPIELVYVLTNIGDICDVITLVAAVLHDTVEDTETTVEELRQNFGSEVTSIVQEVTDDMSLPRDVRKKQQVEHAPSLSRQAKMVKLADLICNVDDVLHTYSKFWSPDRRRNYVEWAKNVVAGLRGVSVALEARFDELYEMRSIIDEQVLGHPLGEQMA